MPPWMLVDTYPNGLEDIEDRLGRLCHLLERHSLDIETIWVLRGEPLGNGTRCRLWVHRSSRSVDGGNFGDLRGHCLLLEPTDTASWRWPGAGSVGVCKVPLERLGLRHGGVEKQRDLRMLSSVLTSNMLRPSYLCPFGMAGCELLRGQGVLLRRCGSLGRHLVRDDLCDGQKMGNLDHIEEWGSMSSKDRVEVR